MKLMYPASKFQTGYVALLSTIIISAVLLIMTIEAGKSGFYTRSIVLDVEAKEQSRLLATHCGNQAVAKFLEDSLWKGEELLIEEYGSCFIYPIQHTFPAEDFLTVRTQGKVRDIVTNLELIYQIKKIHQGTRAIEPAVMPENIETPILYSIKEVLVMP